MTELAVLLPMRLPAVPTYANAGKLDIPIAIPVALGLVVGSAHRIRAAREASQAAVRRVAVLRGPASLRA